MKNVKLPSDINDISIKDMQYIIPNMNIIKLLSNKLNKEIEIYVRKHPELDVIESIVKLCEDNNVRFEDIEEYILETDIVKNLREQNANKNLTQELF